MFHSSITFLKNGGKQVTTPSQLTAHPFYPTTRLSQTTNLCCLLHCETTTLCTFSLLGKQTTS